MATTDQATSLLEKAAALDQVLRECLVHALRTALRKQNFAASGLPALAQIQITVRDNLQQLPPMLQKGFGMLRLDADKISTAVCGLLPTNAQGEMTTAGWVRFDFLEITLRKDTETH